MRSGRRLKNRKTREPGCSVLPISPAPTTAISVNPSVSIQRALASRGMARNRRSRTPPHSAMDLQRRSHASADGPRSSNARIAPISRVSIRKGSVRGTQVYATFSGSKATIATRSKIENAAMPPAVHRSLTRSRIAQTTKGHKR